MRFVRPILLIFLFSGCLNEPDCSPANTNEVKIAFKKDSKTVREITFNEITVSGLSKKFYEGAKVSTVFLPVSPEVSETTITFKFENRNETMLLSYDIFSRVISADCGAFLYHENLRVKETTFQSDSVKVVNNKLLTNATVNIEVYIQ